MSGQVQRLLEIEVTHGAYAVAPITIRPDEGTVQVLHRKGMAFHTDDGTGRAVVLGREAEDGALRFLLMASDGFVRAMTGGLAPDKTAVFDVMEAPVVDGIAIARLRDVAAGVQVHGAVPLAALEVPLDPQGEAPIRVKLAFPAVTARLRCIVYGLPESATSVQVTGQSMGQSTGMTFPLAPVATAEHGLRFEGLSAQAVPLDWQGQHMDLRYDTGGGEEVRALPDPDGLSLDTVTEDGETFAVATVVVRL